MGETGKGVLAALGACVIWGLSPLYWKFFAGMPAEVVLGHRTFWSLVFFGAYLAVQGRLAEVRSLITAPSLRGRVAFAAAMVSVNWFLFIWAIGAGRTVEASLGYYIFPLVSVLFGRVLYAERLGPMRGLAVALAALAVALLTFGLGAAPWISIALALSFASYGMVKKGLGAGALVSVTAEVALVTPVILAVIVIRHGTAIFGPDPATNLFLVLAGLITSIPLIMFSYATKRLRLGTMGVLFYLNPTLQFLVAAMIFAEPVTRWHWIAFPLIWSAVALYSVSAIAQDRAARRRVASASTSGSTVM